jgi:hypothetical protein
MYHLTTAPSTSSQALPRTLSTSLSYQPPQPPNPTIYIYIYIYIYIRGADGEEEEDFSPMTELGSSRGTCSVDATEAMGRGMREKG